MPGYTGIKSFVESVNGDGEIIGPFTWRKAPTQVTTAGVWFDLSMSPGNPTPKYWFDALPLTSVQIKQSTDGGLYHGGNVSPKYKFLKEIMLLGTASTALPMPMILCDYLMYYPTIDESVTDVQNMNNTVSLPRYTDGAGVQIIAVSTATRIGGFGFTISYTNQNGVAGRTTSLVLENSAALVGSLVNTASATAGMSSPFIPLQGNDSGVRSIQSVTMNGSDVGLFTLILVKPLITTQLLGIDAPVEKEFLLNEGKLTRIQDDAFLNWLVLPQGALNATTIHGTITTVFN